MLLITTALWKNVFIFISLVFVFNWSQLLVIQLRASVLERDRSGEISSSDFAGVHPWPAGLRLEQWLPSDQTPVRLSPNSTHSLCRGPGRDRIWRLTLVTGAGKRTNADTLSELQAFQEESSGILWSAVGQFRAETCCYQLAGLCLRTAARTVNNSVYHLLHAQYDPSLLVIWFQCGCGRGFCMIVLQYARYSNVDMYIIFFWKTITVGTNFPYCYIIFLFKVNKAHQH